MSLTGIGIHFVCRDGSRGFVKMWSTSGTHSRVHSHHIPSHWKNRSLSTTSDICEMFILINHCQSVSTTSGKLCITDSLSHTMYVETNDHCSAPNRIGKVATVYVTVVNLFAAPCRNSTPGVNRFMTVFSENYYHPHTGNNFNRVFLSVYLFSL